MRKHLFFAISTALVLAGWFFVIFVLGADKDQGDVFRIMFVHVPVAWCSFMWIFISALCGAMGLMRRAQIAKWDHRSASAMELGTLFATLALITGSIWGRPTWGVWWDWDPRLTSMLVLFLMACGYHILRNYTPDVSQRRNMGAITSILCAVNIPIVYYSVNLWRSVHQPQTFTKASSSASPDVGLTLLFSTIFMILLSSSLFRLRRKGMERAERLQSARESV